MTELKTRPGYKHTELGWIPEEWELKTYDEIFTFLPTATYSRAELSDNQDVGYVHYGDIHTKYNFHLDVSNSPLPSITKEKLKSYPILQDGDLIMADASEDYEGVGKSVEIKNIGNQRVISGLHTFLLRDKQKRTVNGFKGYIHSNQIVKKQFYDYATGMKVYGVSKNNLKKIFVPLPPLPEQQAIATALSDMDAYIRSLEQLIEKKKAIKQAAMQELLTPKEDWAVRKLTDVCWFQEGPGLRNWQFTKSGIKVVNVTNLENGKLNLSKTDRHISIEEFQKMYKHFEIESGDILMASSGNSYSKVAVTRPQDLPLLMNTSVIRFKPLKGTDYGFLLIFLRSDSFKSQIDLLITGGAQPNFGPFHLKRIELNIPNSTIEQSRISESILSFENEIESIENQLSKSISLKQAMMQDLLTGKVRLV
jgi:type I restriction enzyme, S subunit